MNWLGLAAEQLHTRALYRLGELYDLGVAVEQDNEEAVRLYRLAAEQGDAAAHAKLGWMYLAGEGVDRDLLESFRWYYRLFRVARREEN